MNLANSKKTPFTFDSIEPESGLRAALGKSRADIIAEVSASNLRGRGGAGQVPGHRFPSRGCRIAEKAVAMEGRQAHRP